MMATVEGLSQFLRAIAIKWAPPSVVDLPESYKDALAGVTGTFREFSANFIALGSFREGFPTNNT